MVEEGRRHSRLLQTDVLISDARSSRSARRLFTSRCGSTSSRSSCPRTPTTTRNASRIEISSLTECTCAVAREEQRYLEAVPRGAHVDRIGCGGGVSSRVGAQERSHSLHTSTHRSPSRSALTTAPQASAPPPRTGPATHPYISLAEVCTIK